MRRTIWMDDSIDLESLSLDEPRRTPEAGETAARDPHSAILPPSAIERSRRCESSERELLRDRARLDFE
jgi:hypothetical protein